MSNIVLSSQDIKKGKKGEAKASGAFTQPLQFLPMEEKDLSWGKQNLDFFEYRGLRQIYQKAPNLSKNYNFAHGIIDRTDYVGTGANEHNELLVNLYAGNGSETYLDLKFYPIIPSFINTLCTEFAERNTKIM